MPQNRAVILVNIIVAVSEVEFTTDGPPNLHTFKKKGGPGHHYEEDLEVFADIIEDGNLQVEEFMNEYCEVIDTVRFLSTSLFRIH